MAAAAGQVSLHFLNTSGAQRVAPFGGSDRRLSTNPISIGVPIAGGDPVVLDVTTSTVAEGKLMVALNKGERMPEGWIIDKAGAPTTDPKDFYAGGALLTVGAHKGSGLSMVTDLLAGAVSTGRSSDPDDTILRNNMLSIYIAPDVYDPQGGVAREARRFVDFVKASPPARPGEPVLAPGDVERRNRASRLASGVPLDDKTWADLIAAAASVGIDAEAGRSIRGLKKANAAVATTEDAIVKRIASGTAGLALVLLATLAQAQAWPSKPIKWVVPFAPGGTTDILARTVGEKLALALGQPVVIENKPGAGGGVGAEFTAKAAPDGYTIMGGTISTHAINASLYAKLPYDPVKDFVAITLIARVPNMLVVNRRCRRTT